MSSWIVSVEAPCLTYSPVAAATAVHDVYQALQQLPSHLMPVPSYKAVVRSVQGLHTVRTINGSAASAVMPVISCLFAGLAVNKTGRR